ncbi:hypothetical protein [Aeromicrobium sp.]|uniref:hypothetical protein n=1 Tax=Aeromicrobium sp. TaxID=1871063 RepID=UPI002FC630FE
MTLATSVAVTALLAVSGCNDSGNKAEPGASPSTSESASPSTSATPDKADLVGTWSDEAAEWTVHFNDDGTFVEDYQGIKDFRVGTYSVDGETVALKGDDGITTAGSIVGVTLAFKLGTLIRN